MSNEEDAGPSRSLARTPRTPQDKKALGHLEDRRNAYGENHKASRKAIPLRKAGETRKRRRKTAQALAGLPALDEGGAAIVENSARHDIGRVGA